MNPLRNAQDFRTLDQAKKLERGRVAWKIVGDLLLLALIIAFAVFLTGILSGLIF